MGGDLKRKEKLSARLGDILAQMYLISATLKRYEAEGRQAGRCAADALGDLGCHVQGAGGLRRRHRQLPEPLLRLVAASQSSSRSAIPTWCRPTASATRLRAALITAGATRDRLTADCYRADRRRGTGRRHRTGAGRDARSRTDRGQDPRGREGRAASTTTRRANVRDIATAAFEMRRHHGGRVRGDAAAQPAARHRGPRRRFPLRLRRRQRHQAGRQSAGLPDAGTDLRRRRRAHAVPQGAERARGRSPPPISRSRPAGRCCCASRSRRAISTKSFSAAPRRRPTKSTSAAWSPCASAAATRCRAGR